MKSQYSMGVAFVYAYINYYIFWWFTPLFVSTIFFYFQMYVLMPLIVLAVPIGTICFGVGLAAAAEQNRRR